MQMHNYMKKEPTIDGQLFSQFGGAVLAKYTVGATEVENVTHLGVNRTSWMQLKTLFKMRPIKLDVKFRAKDIHTATVQKSQFDGRIFGQHELWLPDGYFYTVYAESLGEAAVEANTDFGAIIGASYSFQGIRHGPLISLTIPAGGGTVNCLSTMPYTDALFQCTVPVATPQYTLGGAVFANVQAGEVLVIDGISKKILRNGQPNALNVSWLNFPQLTPGLNTVSGTYPTIIQYYPTYI